MLGSQHMTFPTEDDKTKAYGTYPGMAFFAGTGPIGKCCEDCKFFGYRRESAKGRWSEEQQSLVYNSYRVSGCEKYRSMTSTFGPEIPKQARSCKYFEDKKKRARAQGQHSKIVTLV